MFFVLIFTHLFCVALATFDPQATCALLPNGTKYKDPRACNSWIACVNHTFTTGVCPVDLFYDFEIDDCVPNDAIACTSSDPCAPSAGSDGFFANPYNCNTYYYCHQNVATIGNCSVGFNFNPKTGNCERNYTCAENREPEYYCNMIADGVFIMNSSAACNNYMLCWNETLLQRKCPSTFYYNAFDGVCDYPENVNCTEKMDPLANDICKKNGEFLTDNSTCNGYYLCWQSADMSYELIHGVCDDGRFFAPANDGGCIKRTDIVCEYERCVNFGETKIELVNEIGDGCLGFAICQNGTKIGAGVCPNGEYFDEIIQLCTTRIISYTACQLSATTTTTTTANANTNKNAND